MVGWVGGMEAVVGRMNGGQTWLRQNRHSLGLSSVLRQFSTITTTDKIIASDRGHVEMWSWLIVVFIRIMGMSKGEWKCKNFLIISRKKKTFFPKFSVSKVAMFYQNWSHLGSHTSGYYFSASASGCLFSAL